MAPDKKVYPIQARDTETKANAVRREGFVPGVIYGGRLEGAHPFKVKRSVLTDMFKHNTKSSVINVTLEGDEGAVIVKEIQNNPVTGEILHVDFQAIRKDEVLTMGVPITYHGEEEVSSRRLVLNLNITELMVKGPADKLPEGFEVDLTGKGVEDRFEAGSIELPEGVELAIDADELLFTIAESKVEQEVEEEDLEAAEEAAAEEPAEPELVGEEDKTEE